MRVLPRHLLGGGGISEVAQPLGKPGVRRRKLVRPHRRRPAVAGMADRPHDLRLLAVQIVPEAQVPVPPREVRGASAAPTASPPQKSSALGPAGAPLAAGRPLYPCSRIRSKSDLL